MRKEREHPSQLSFLAPDDAALINLMRRFVAEASRIYEAPTRIPVTDALQINKPYDAYQFLRTEMEDLEQEQLRTIQLNTKCRIISSRLIYQGTVNETHIRAAEVFRHAILDNATSLILCHNHPSGDPSPSPEDVAITRQLVKAGELLDIELTDHIVIGKGKFVSLKERGLGFT